MEIGYGKTSRALIEIPAEEVEMGVYELDVFNPGTARATIAVTAGLSLVALAPRAGATLEVSNPGQATATLMARGDLIGAERVFEIKGGGAAAESLTVMLPPWAARSEIMIDMPHEQWDRFTDFGVTTYDPAGQQVETTPLNYARGRHAFRISSRLSGRPVVYELFPAFARAEAAGAWEAVVRVRVLRDVPELVQAAVRLDVVAGGRATLPVVTPTLLPLPEGFVPLVRWRLTPVSGGPDAIGFQPVRAP